MSSKKCKTPEAYDLLYKTNTDSLKWNLQEFLNSPKKNRILYFLNAHGLNMCMRQTHFADVLLKGDYVLRDGIGIKLAFKFFDLPETENLNGTDLIPQILPHYKDKKIAIFGASDETLKIVAEKLQSQGYEHIISLQHGFYELEHYVEECKKTNPDLVILCMGMPKQELLSTELSAYAPLVICAGGWADFYSGLKHRAPEWMRKYSIEWIHRLVSEPRRLGKRYTVDLVIFFLNLFKIKRSVGKSS